MPLQADIVFCLFLFSNLAFSNFKSSKMDDVFDDSINLRALKKIDDNIQEILFSAGQVAIYNFDGDNSSWKRKDIEGPLFFVRRSLQPQHAFVVINRLNTINLVQKINKELETSLQTPYLMYKNAENEIYCVWFYTKEYSVVLNDKISETIDKLKQQTFSNSITHFNGFNANLTNSVSSNSDLLKKILSVENSVEVDSQKQNPNHFSNDLVKPIAQRRSLNVKVEDLFGTSLNNSTETSTPLKTDNEKIKNDVHFPQFKNEEKIIDKMTNLSVSNFEPPKETPKIATPLIDALFDHQKLPANNFQFESKARESKPTKQKDSENPLYLSMEQLKKTMIYLLQNDADFLHSIHTTYVNEIKK